MSVMRLRDAFDDALSYALMQDNALQGAGLPSLAEQDASQEWRVQRAANTVAAMIDPGPSVADWRTLMYVAASALVALNAVAEVKVHTGGET